MCFDFLPDGRLVLVSNQQRALLTLEVDGTLATYAELAGISDLGCNDIVVDGRGFAFVNSPHFDFASGPPPGDVQPGRVGVVTPDGAARVVAEDIAFPNGMAVTADGGTLVVADSYRHQLVGFTIADDGSLTDRRVWADLGDPTTPTASASMRTEPPGTPTFRTGAASGSRRAARCCRPSSWTAAASPACSGGTDAGVPLCGHGGLARRGRADVPHRVGRPGRADPRRRPRCGLAGPLT